MKFPGFGIVWVPVIVFASAAGAPAGEPAAQMTPVHPAPPAHPPIINHLAGAFSAQSQAQAYSIGDPTPEEQLYLEMINRARANPVAEGQIFYNTTDARVRASYNNTTTPPYWIVDLALMTNQFNLIPPTPPLAMNAKLIQVARAHSQDMFNNAFQSHDGSDGSTIGTRITAAGYSFSRVAENIYAYADSVFHGHAGFEVDWGPGTGGMQTPPGHRENIHSSDYRELGVGVVLGNNTANGNTVGPQIVSQEFGVQQNSTPFITGVVFFDLNGNNFYDPGEGIGGATVSATVVNGGFTGTGISARSGGYAVPVAANGNYTVTFSLPGLAPVQKSATITNSANVKVDFTPQYFAPQISGSSSVETNVNTTFAFTTVPGAAEYQWRSFQRIAPSLEGAENGSGRVAITAGDYNVIQSEVKRSGNNSFHFATPPVNNRPVIPSVTLTPKFLIRPNSSLRFESRLGWATPDQEATVQVSSNEGLTWTTVYEQAGSGNSGEGAFASKSVPLAQFAGEILQVRFIFEADGSFFPRIDAGVGWYVDDIQLVDADEVTNEQIQTASPGSFAFNPSVISSFGLQVRAKTGHNFLDWGPLFTITSTPTKPEFRFTEISIVQDGIQVDFELTKGLAPGTVVIQGRSNFSEAWSNEPTTPLKIGDTTWRATLPRRSGPKFFQVRGI